MRKKIKIIDLLCYISTGDYDIIPKKFKCEFEEKWIWNGKTYEREDGANFNWEYYIEDSSLNDEVEIIDEEDEFEDIEEVDVEYDNDGKLSRIINQLIKNQKKIIERLKENE